MNDTSGTEQTPQVFTVTAEQLNQIVNQAIEKANAAADVRTKRVAAEGTVDDAMKMIDNHPSFVKYLGKEKEAKAMGITPEIKDE